jgi:hypothetical protein
MFTSVILHEFKVQGVQDLDNEPAITSFVVTTKAMRENIIFPEPGPNFYLEKKVYVEKYGPYSLEDFETIMKDQLANFKESIKLRDTRRILRRLWILKQMYELFDGSVGLLVIGKPNLLSHSITKALEVLRDPGIEMIMDDRCQPEGIKKIIARCLQVITRVYTKIANVVTNDANLLKLLPTTSLFALVEYASQPMVSNMVSKFRRLPWIDPALIDRVSPKFNAHWQKLWYRFLVRNLHVGKDICFIIAEFMPMEFKKESFLSFFQRKYDSRTQEFFGERVFDVEHLGNFVKVILN